jgi:hypothetical protein
MELRTCDHLKEDGFYCKSPALRGRDYCCFHLKLRGRRLNMARARALAADQPLDLPFPEDMHSVQVTLFEVVNALVNKRIDTKTAGIVLYAMQQASINLNNRHESQNMCQSVKPDAPMLALEFRDFEEQYHLPKRIDLEADPETALQDAGVLPDDAAGNCLLGAPPAGAPDERPGVARNCLPLAIVGSRQEAPPVGGSQLPAGNCGITSPEQKSAMKKKKHRRRGERVPLPKGLWKVADPDAPFRAYTSDGRELTREDARRWQSRVYAEMEALLEHGGEPGWKDDIA